MIAFFHSSLVESAMLYVSPKASLIWNCLVCRGQSYQKHEVFLSHSGLQKQFVNDLFNEFLNYHRFLSNPPFFDVHDDSLPKGEIWRDRLIKMLEIVKWQS